MTAGSRSSSSSFSSSSIVELIIVLAISRWRDVSESSLTQQQVTRIESARSDGSLEQAAPSALHVAFSFQGVLK